MGRRCADQCSAVGNGSSCLRWISGCSCEHACTQAKSPVAMVYGICKEDTPHVACTSSCNQRAAAASLTSSHPTSLPSLPSSQNCSRSGQGDVTLSACQQRPCGRSSSSDSTEPQVPPHTLHPMAPLRPTCLARCADPSCTTCMTGTRTASYSFRAAGVRPCLQETGGATPLDMLYTEWSSCGTGQVSAVGTNRSSHCSCFSYILSFCGHLGSHTHLAMARASSTASSRVWLVP
jgi:hypothetical protein